MSALADNPIYAIMKKAREASATDVHIPAKEERVRIRVKGRLRLLDDLVRPTDVKEFIREMWPEDEVRRSLQERGAIGGSHEDRDVGPIRLQAFNVFGGTKLAIRLLHECIPAYADLGLPDTLPALVRRESGLVLCVGPTRSGKTTSQASLIDGLLKEKETQGYGLHLVTLENPIEYRFKSAMSAISQIEIGAPGMPKTFSAGMEELLREDPDIALIGELRNTATMAAAVEISEQGRTCFASIHARDASSVPERIIGAFPGDEQNHVRTQLANGLAAVVVLRLLPVAQKERDELVPACEVLVVTDPVRELIRKGEYAQIRNMIKNGRAEGMVTLEDSLKELLDAGKIDLDTAKSAAIFKTEIVGRGPAAVGIRTREPARPVFAS